MSDLESLDRVNKPVQVPARPAARPEPRPPVRVYSRPSAPAKSPAKSPPKTITVRARQPHGRRGKLFLLTSLLVAAAAVGLRSNLITKLFTRSQPTINITTNTVPKVVTTAPRRRGHKEPSRAKNTTKNDAAAAEASRGGPANGSPANPTDTGFTAGPPPAAFRPTPDQPRDEPAERPKLNDWQCEQLATLSDQTPELEVPAECAAALRSHAARRQQEERERARQEELARRTEEERQRRDAEEAERKRREDQVRREQTIRQSVEAVRGVIRDIRRRRN